MGRVIRGARFREERYTLAVPEIALPVADPTIPDAAASPGSYDFDPAPELDVLDGTLLATAFDDPAVDADAIHAQALALLDDASRNAEVLLTDAHDRARALIEDAARAPTRSPRTRASAGTMKASRPGARRPTTR